MDLSHDSQLRNLISNLFYPICWNMVIKNLHDNFLKIHHKVAHIRLKTLAFSKYMQMNLIVTVILFFLC